MVNLSTKFYKKNLLAISRAGSEAPWFCWVQWIFTASCRIRSICYRIENPAWSAEFVATFGESAECGWVPVNSTSFETALMWLGSADFLPHLADFTCFPEWCHAFSQLSPHAFVYRPSYYFQLRINLIRFSFKRIANKFFKKLTLCNFVMWNFR